MSAAYRIVSRENLPFNTIGCDRGENMGTYVQVNVHSQSEGLLIEVLEDPRTTCFSYRTGHWLFAVCYIALYCYCIILHYIIFALKFISDA